MAKSITIRQKRCKIIRSHFFELGFTQGSVKIRYGVNIYMNI